MHRRETTSSRRWCLGRGVSALLAAALSLLVSAVARAGLATSDTIGSGDVGKTLKNNTVYVVPKSATLTRTTPYTALYVEPGATTVLYIPNGVTLTVNGGNASGTEGAGAGIRVDPGSTLVVTGEGTLNVTGGNAANGGKGGDWRKNGSWDGSADVGSSHVDTTGGGHGGAGGGGASPAIGGIGGNGGNGGNGGDGYRTKTDGDCDKNGNDGSNGTKGNDGTSMGTLYVLGSVTVNATGGSAGSGGGGGTSDTGDTDYWARRFCAGGGGAGAGGGGGGAVAYAIGGGAGGGGGGSDWTTLAFSLSKPEGATGGVGKGGSNDGGEGSVTSRSKGYSGRGKEGGDGGSGGSGGATGGNGMAYLAPGASFSGTGNFLSADTHPAIEYKLTFDDEWRTNEVHDVKLGYALPTSAPVMSRGSYRFLGWFDRQNALGTKYYNADGTLANPQFPWYSVVGNLTLYAGWQLESGTQPSITVTVAGVTNAITGGVSMSDPNGNFSYDGTTGILALSKASATYEISGSETNGEIRVVAEQNCMVILNSFSLDGSMQPNVIPLTVSAGRTVTLSVQSGAQLKARDGCPAVSLGQGANLAIAGNGVINLAGGAGAADIALADGASSASVWVNTRGPDIHFGTGVLGEQPSFFSSNGSGTRIWRVKVPVGGTPRSAVSWAGLPDAYSPQNTIAGAGGESYLWLPDGAYTFSSLTSTGAKEWVVRVSGAHREAIPFVPTGLLINEVDTGHAAGPGWYWDEDHTVFLTNAGPFTVSGSTTAGVG